MNKKTCCFTGHRNINKYNLEKLETELENAIEELISNGVVNFEAGGALGFDTIAALNVLKLRKRFQQIKLILVLPCRNQADNWNESDVETYEYIKSQADECIYTSEDYNKGCMLKRNRYMVDHAEYVIAAWDGQKAGGTYATVNYAQKLNRKIINLKLSLSAFLICRRQIKSTNEQRFCQVLLMALPLFIKNIPMDKIAFSRH